MKTNEIEFVDIDFREAIQDEILGYSDDEINRVNLETITLFKKSNKLLRYINAFFKRAIDIIGALVGFILLIPLTAIVAIMHLLEEDDGPLFFVQERIGKNGKIFAMYKFRTMVVGADEILKDLLANDEKAREEYKKYKKLSNDPRITKFGEFLRKTSLDEFPQFINVLKGEMSLVGPRPYLPREKDEMGIAYKPIIQSRPGVTGLWQTNGRSNVTFEDRLNMDLEYYQKNSCKFDIEILLKTVVAVFCKEGAE